MRIVTETHLRGSIKTFKIAHNSKKLGRLTILTNSTSSELAKSKAMDEVRKLYRKDKGNCQRRRGLKSTIVLDKRSETLKAMATA